jgi:purine-binding chemotaxis protein CheW
MELVLFELGQSRFAFPARGISKVLEPLAVTPLPYAPPEVEGLVNVGGNVVVKLDLASKLGMSQHEVSENGNLLLVSGSRDTVVVQVDRVLRKVEVADDELSVYGNDGATSMICGELTVDGTLTLLLDESRLVLDGVRAHAVPEGGGGLLGHALEYDGRSGSAVQRLDLPVLAVRDGGEIFAFHMRDVREIVDIAAITELPGASPEIEGLMQLRGTALLVLSMAGLLGQKRDEPAVSVIIVSTGDISVGISVAGVIGIENHESGDLQALAVGDSQLEGYLPGKGEWAARMTGLVSMGGLLSPDRLERYKRYLSKHGGEVMLIEREIIPTRKLLSFNVADERCALELSRVERIEEFFEGVALPDGDAAAPTIIQIKGELAASLDLRKLLGVNAAAPAEAPVYILVRVDGANWALLADRVDGVIDIPEPDITPVRSRQSDYLPEVGKYDGRLYSLLSLDPLANRTS